MPLVDLEKTSYKFKDVLLFISGALFVAGMVWRLESNSAKTNSNIDALETKIMYKYELEILKINNRMDLIEARKFTERKAFKSDTLSVNLKMVQFNDRTSNREEKEEKYPQFCMITARVPECQKKKLVDFKKIT